MANPSGKQSSRVSGAQVKVRLTKFLIALLVFGRLSPLSPVDAATQKTRPVVLDFGPYIKLWQYFPEVEFDKTSKLISAIWKTWATNSDYGQVLHYAIFNEKGAIQCTSESETNQDLVLCFPRLAMLALHPKQILREDNYNAYTNQFLDNNEWDASPDLKTFVRVRWGDNYAATVEHWNLAAPPAKLWQWTIDGQGSKPLCRPRFDRLHEQPVVAVDCGAETVFLDAATGAELDKIAYKKSNEIFVAGASAIVPVRNYFACAGFDSTRLRIFSLKAPHHILKELGRERSHLFGSWSTQFIQCSSDGRFLLKTSHYGSRLFPSKAETVIYDTATWKAVWRVNEDMISMSPDGKKLAFIRGHTLEIRSGPSK